MTVEFLEEVKRLLPDDGMVVANTFSTSRLYAAESNTYREVFGEIYNLRMSGTLAIALSSPPCNRCRIPPHWNHAHRLSGKC